jgi:hypothetical protein
MDEEVCDLMVERWLVWRCSSMRGRRAIPAGRGGGDEGLHTTKAHYLGLMHVCISDSWLSGDSRLFGDVVDRSGRRLP